MSEIMIIKFKEICPPQQLKTMYMVDVEDAVLTAFREVGYTPSKNLKKSIDRVWANSNREDYLWEFVYNVWREDS